MLINTINSCVKLVQDQVAAKNRKKSLDEYKSTLSDLNSVCIEIDKIQKCSLALRQRGIHTSPIFTTSTKRELLDALDGCGRGVMEGSLGSESVKALHSSVNAAKAELSSVWAKSAPSYSGGTALYLSTIAGLTENPDYARELSDKIIILSHSPYSSKSIEELSEKVEEANSITSNFTINSEIELFLQKVSSNKATIQDLSPSVQEWLTEQGLNNKLRIIF